MLTRWALHGLSQRETQIADFLKDSYDKEAGGWAAILHPREAWP